MIIYSRDLGGRAQLAPVLARVDAQRTSPQWAGRADTAPDTQRNEMESLPEVSWRILLLVDGAPGVESGRRDTTEPFEEARSLNSHLHPVRWRRDVSS